MNLREAFVYFSTKQDMEEYMESLIRIGDHEMVWGDQNDKRCRECGIAGHIQRECEIYIEQVETRVYIRAVKEYQRGGPLRVTALRSYVVGCKYCRKSRGRK